jgi:hypothetical protein
MKLKLEGEVYKNNKKERELEAKERKRKDNLEVARSVSSKGFTIPHNEQERAAIFQPPQQQQQYYQPPMQQYQPQYAPLPPHYQPYQPYHQPPQQYQPPMQQYQPQYAPPPPHYQYAPTPHHQPGVSQIYPPPPPMARASSASSVTPTPEKGANYATDQELEQATTGNSLGFPEDTQREEVRGAEAVVGESQNSDITEENQFA